MSQVSVAQLREPDAKNGVKIKPNPTATITEVCHQLDKRDYSQLIHSMCYSEFNKAVVVLVSGNAKSATGQRIAEFVTGEFEKAYIPAVGFLRFQERDKVAIVFILNGDTYGPYSGNNWLDGFKILKVHAGQAWYPRK